MSYNGYANEDEFHSALADRRSAYVQRQSAAKNTQHANCDHSSGYCQNGAR